MPFKSDTRGGSPPPTHTRAPQKVTFHFVIPFSLTKATALSIPY